MTAWARMMRSPAMSYPGLAERLRDTVGAMTARVKMRRSVLGLAIARALTPSLSARAQSPGEKIVDAADLALSPDKYADRDLMVIEMHCYYADVGDYLRCMSLDSEPILSVFTTELTNDVARLEIENNCDAIRVAMTSPHCLVALHFRYTQDQIDSRRGVGVSAANCASSRYRPGQIHRRAPALTPPTSEMRKCAGVSSPLWR